MDKLRAFVKAYQNPLTGAFLAFGLWCLLGTWIMVGLMSLLMAAILAPKAPD